MSTLKVDGIRSNSASSDAITLASDGTCTANITNNLSNRRINQNGQMSVAQRGTSITSQGYTPDRYYQKFSDAGSITHTISQQSLTSSDTPYSLGFRYYQRHALSGAGTANANASLYTQHTIEAQDMAQSGWDYTSSSSYLSISFWVRVSTSQKFYLNLRTRDGTSQAYNIPFTPSANTWTKVTAQVQGNSNLQFDTDNDKGLHLNFYKFLGTDDTGGSSENAWAAYSGTAKVPDMASTWLTAGASTFDLTGLQVEVGSNSTDYEFRSYGQELALCQRYYFKLTGDDNDFLLSGFTYSASLYYFIVDFPQVMRAFPSYTGSATAARFFTDNPSQDFNLNTLTIAAQATTTYPSSMWLHADQGGAGVASGGVLQPQNAVGTLEFSSEL